MPLGQVDLTSRAQYTFDSWKPQDAHSRPGAAEYYQVCALNLDLNSSLMTASSLTWSKRKLQSKSLLLLHLGWVAKASIIILQVVTKSRNYRQTTSHTNADQGGFKALVQEGSSPRTRWSSMRRSRQWRGRTRGRDHVEQRDDDCGRLCTFSLGVLQNDDVTFEPAFPDNSF